MSHLYCYRQKYICDSHIRKSVFSAESVQILVAVFIHLSHKLFVTWILVTLGAFYVLSQLRLAMTGWTLPQFYGCYSLDYILSRPLVMLVL